MMLERAQSRRTQGEILGRKQSVQQMISDSWIELQQFRLLVLQTAWIIDNTPHGTARINIAMCKVAMARLMHDVIQRALHLHGSLGTTLETPLAGWWASVPQLALADGPTEVHQGTVAKELLKRYDAAPGLFPTEHIPTRLAAARTKHDAVLAEFGL